MPASEFAGWVEFYELEPFGAWRDNFHSATVASALVNMWLPKGKSVSAKDFMYEDGQIITGTQSTRNDE